MLTKYFYMIKRNSDGLFSSGGTSVKFTKKGKVWNTIGHLKNHLHQFLPDGSGRGLRFPYKDCTVVILERVEVINPVPQLEDWSVESFFNKLKG